MSAELVAANVASLEALDPQAREVMVTRMLSEARSWLAHAVEATEPTTIANFKAAMATVAEATKQLNLSKEIQLDSQEMVRRAERGMDKAIRKGQASGTVNTDANSAAIRYGRLDKNSIPPSPATFFDGNGQARSDAYQMGNVDDEQFEDILASAKEEENLSRANVVRKARALKETGELPATPERKKPGNARAHRRTIEAVINGLSGYSMALAEITELDGSVTNEEAARWVGDLSEAIRTLRRIQSLLKESNK